MLPIVPVKTAQLLLSMGRVIPAINIEHDFTEGFWVAIDESGDHLASHR
jgi:hypothetical protein